MVERRKRPMSLIQFSLRNREESSQSLQELPRGSSFPCLPPSQRARIDPQAMSQVLLCEAQKTTSHHGPFLQGPGCGIAGRVAQEGDDAWHEAERRRCAVRLPVIDRVLMHAQSLGHLSLEKLQVQPSLPQVVTEGLQLRGIGGWSRFPGTEGQMAKRQRNGAYAILELWAMVAENTGRRIMRMLRR